MNDEELNLNYVVMVGRYRHREFETWEEADRLRKQLEGSVLNVVIGAERKERVPA